METATINEYSFEGPYPLETTTFNNVAGVYFVHDGAKKLDVGETDALSDRLANHERKPCWQKNRSGIINIWFHSETNKDRRLMKEKTIRNSNTFSCGKI